VGSVVSQTFTGWELLLVNDGSTDGGEAVARAWAEKDARIRLLTTPGQGIVCALNTGLREARAPLIARMDADDVSHPERLGRQAAALEENPGLGLIGCCAEFGGEEQRQAGYALHVDWTNTLVSEEDLRLNRFVESPFAHPTVMFRRECVEQYGAYRDGDFPEDYELWLRWWDAGVRMAKLPERLLTWNDPPSRLSRTHPRYSPDAFFRIKAPYVASELSRIFNLPGSGAERRKLFIWGAGRPTRKRAAELERHGLAIAGYIDIDAKKIGHEILGRPVVSPSAIGSPTEIFVVGYVSTRGARDLIRAQLKAKAFVEGRDFLMCA
jgi:glycosyltransferase involved in cell wall biosynthesis